MYLPHCSFHSLLRGNRSSTQVRSFVMACRLSCAAGSGFVAVFADGDAPFVHELVRRNYEIGRGGNAFEHPARKIELGLMAGAEESAEPVRTQISRRDLRAEGWRTSKMGADADRNEHTRPDRAIL